MVRGGYEWLWVGYRVVTGGFGWFLVVTNGYEWLGWLWVVMAWFGAVLDGYEWLRVITCSLGLDMGG